MNNNKSFASYSAPISIVLSGIFGERYGKPLLVCAVDYQVTCSIQKGVKQSVKYPNTSSHIEKEVIHYLTQKSIPFQVPPHQFRVSTTDLANIDSSSALTVAATASYLSFFTGKNFNQTEINTLAYHIEKKRDKVTMGYRTSTSCLGGIIYARREFEFLKTLSRLPFKLAPKLQNCLYIGQLSKDLTGDMKFDISDLYNKNPKKVESILNTLEKNTRRLTVAIASENVALFHDGLKSDQLIWEKMNSRNSFFKKFLSEFSSQEAVTPILLEKKPAILIFLPNKKKVQIIAKKYQIKVWLFRLAHEGLRQLTEAAGGK